MADMWANQRRTRWVNAIRAWDRRLARHYTWGGGHRPNPLPRPRRQDCLQLGARRFYLSGRWARRQELADLAVELEAATRRLAWTGWRSCASWLHAPPDAPNLGPDDRLIAQSEAALTDLNDLHHANLVICFTEANPDGDHVPASWARGGRHFEAGYAHARGIPTWVIGPTENIFYALAAEYWPVDAQVDDLAASMVQLAERLNETIERTPSR